MVDLSRDVDEYFAELRMVEKFLIEGKTETQKGEVVALLKAVVEAPAGPSRKAAMVRLFTRLEQMHHKNQASRLSA